MNAILRSLAMVVAAAGLVRAEETPVRVVVLDNESLLEGRVSRVADGYEVHRPVGGDITVPAERVVAVVANRKAAFGIVARRANRRDADERLRLAKWCQAHELNEEALAEAEAAARMRPGFTAAERLAESLRALTKMNAAGPGPAIVPAKAVAPAKDTVTDVPAIEYNSESFPIFATKVNPILMNTCASCHAKDDAKVFPLTRTGGRAAIIRNLTAALAHVNPADPTASPILAKALTPHGGATEAPLKGRTHPAYQALETWARFARAPEGTRAPEPLVAAPMEPRKLPDLDTTPGRPGDVFGKDSKSVSPKPLKNPVDDPFDPEIFNGQARPKK